MSTEGSTSLAFTRLRALIGSDANPDRMWMVTHPGPPISKARARWSGKGHTYTPQRTATAEQSLAVRLADSMKGETLGGSVAIIATFYRQNYQRVDADNLMKLVMDAATKAKLWKDDCYVIAQASFMEFDRENPRTVIAWCEAKSSFDRTALLFTCRTCGKPFSRKGAATFAKPPECCSRECRAEMYRQTRVTAKCPKCDIDFMRKTAGQRYCSRECSASAPRVRQPSSTQRPPSLCEVCGSRVSRREYKRCASCSVRARPTGSKNKPKEA